VYGNDFYQPIFLNLYEKASLWYRLYNSLLDRAIAQAISASLLMRRPVFAPESFRVGFVVDELALGQLFDFPLSI
jgi:hypothetical protein